MSLTTQTFDILTRLAIGNGALVYRAVEKGSLRQVALKLLTQDGDIDHRFDLEALFADAPGLKAIHGVHVCQLLDAYTDEDGPVLVYEFANGLNGAEFPLQRKLDAAQAVDVAAQLMSALRSGERQRMPHGDLKPSNIMFVDMPEGRPFTFVLDWGLAAYRTSTTDDSLFYRAPERLLGEGLSHKGDLFSAGAVLFYLLTGKVLVSGLSAEQVAEEWHRVRAAALADLRPDLPGKFVQWVCSLLELDPGRRPASAVEASASLAAFNPPPPMVTPEAIRPRPIQSGPPTRLPVPSPAPSSVVKPPVVRSGVRPAPASSISVPQPRIIPKPAPVKKGSSPVLSILLLLALAGGGGGGWYYWKKTQEAAADNAAAAASLRMGQGARTVPSPATPAELLAAAKGADWETVKPPSPPKASGGTKLVAQGDGSFLATGGKPAQDEYVFEFKLPSPSITALRIEALTHASFPGGGPGRSGNGNFVLSGIKVEQPRGPKSFRLAAAVADFEQSGYPASGVVDFDSATGWAVDGQEKHQDRVIWVAFAEPVSEPDVRVKIGFQGPHQQHTIGRIRLSVTSDPRLTPSATYSAAANMTAASESKPGLNKK